MQTWACSPSSIAGSKILLGETQHWCIRIQIKWWKNGGQQTTSLGMTYSKGLCLPRPEPLSTSQDGRSGEKCIQTLRHHIKTGGLALCTKSKKKPSTASALPEGKCPDNRLGWVARNVGQPRCASWEQGHQMWCYPLKQELHLPLTWQDTNPATFS